MPVKLGNLSRNFWWIFRTRFRSTIVVIRKSDIKKFDKKFWYTMQVNYQDRSITLQSWIRKRRDSQSQGFLFLGFESQRWKSWDFLNDFCLSFKSSRDSCAMGRFWDSQNSWDCLGLESRIFEIFIARGQGIPVPLPILVYSGFRIWLRVDL